MALSTQPYKGARDFYPEDKRLQKYIFNTWRDTVEKFGYEEYDAPVLEPIELYLAKTGDEIVNEQTYTFTDRGDRKVVVRPEMTPTVSRMVAAKRQELAYPVRWYSIPNLWRYERPQRGRLREHWQLNVDAFGLPGLEAEHEMILLADAIMKAFKANDEMYSIRINSRKLMTVLLNDYLQLDETQSQSMAKLIDRMHKIDHAEFVGLADAIFTPSQREAGTSEKFSKVLSAKTINELPDELVSQESVEELRKLFKLLDQSGIDNYEFDPSIMRGFDYYTDIVFEVFDQNPDNNRSMFGGGRYDGLVGLFGVDPVPTVGFGMGDVTLQNFLEAHGLTPHLSSETDVYTILIGDVYDKAQPVIKDLREMGLNIAVDATGRKMDKQIRTAVKSNIPYALFIGENELEEGQFKLKNLDTGEEESHSAQRIVSIVKDYRQQ